MKFCLDVSTGILFSFKTKKFLSSFFSTEVLQLFNNDLNNFVKTGTVSNIYIAISRKSILVWLLKTGYGT